ncbi:30S ribosomal protein S17 [Corynebacterium alimapuense]|uniref:Small ribosomal subunit protein uS17 n=1 Tax=Corynebacterium alimapuense TaxID=1576874 RepID=A0A3M8K6W9_9CORY|nr:30S ribosomal protein S17 [Corynebacterium alimapuense]RNE48896.1 30S ribosomal protein S17 [Corynebacterium alimapuense]
MSEATVTDTDKGVRKQRSGYVVSDKMQKTIIVELEDRKSHALYGKTIRSNSRVKAHDENEIAGVGDLVLISETRPMSKDKHFRLVEIIEKAK